MTQEKQGNQTVSICAKGLNRFEMLVRSLILWALLSAGMLGNIPLADAQDDNSNLNFKLSVTLSDTNLKICVAAENRTDSPLLFPGPFHFNRGGVLLEAITSPSGLAPIKRPPRSGGGGFRPPPPPSNRLSYELLQASNQLRTCTDYNRETILVDKLTINVSFTSWLQETSDKAFSGTDLLTHTLTLKDAGQFDIGRCEVTISEQQVSCQQF